MRDKILTKLADLHSSHPWKMLTGAIIVTIMFAFFAMQLSINMQMKDLMPSGDPKVDQFNQIIDEFDTATSIIVVVQGEEQRIKAFAESLAPRVVELVDTTQNVRNKQKILELENKIGTLRDQKKIADLQTQIKELQRRINFKLFQRVDYKTDTDFLSNHALILVKEDDLKNTGDTFSDPNLVGLLTNINNSLQKEYVEREKSMSTRDKEDGAVGFLDGIESLSLLLEQAVGGEELTKDEVQRTADKFLLGEPYFLSYDKTTLLLNVIPNFTIMDRDLLMVGFEETQALVNNLLIQYPDVRAGLSGDVSREHDEQVYSQQTLGYTSLIAMVAIFLLLVISFRMWVAPFLAILTLVIGVIWANGLAFLVVGRLNMMTALLSVVLLGLGIDFAIHIIAGMTEWRAAGDSIQEAMRKTFVKSGKGIITGALTTACAFLALLVSRSRGMKEMGIVTGVGLLAIMMATFIFLPVMLVLRERLVEYIRKKRGKTIVKKRDITFHSIGTAALWLSKRYVFTLVVSAAVSAILIWAALHIGYEQNYMKMEPKGLTSIALADTITEKFDLSMEYALCLTNSVQESRELAESFRELGTVAMTNDICLYLPSQKEQQQRVPYVREIDRRMRAASVKKTYSVSDLPKLKEELERLEMNVMEMQDMAFIGGQDKVDNKCKQIVGDPENPDAQSIFRRLLEKLESQKGDIALQGLTNFQQYFAPYFKEKVLKMCSTDPIKLSDLPVSVLDRYSNSARDKFMITIYPSGQLWTDADMLNRFVDDMERVTPKATGTPLVAVAWLKIAARDGRNAILLTLTIVFLLLWADFRNPKYALIAMIPLLLGVFWMVGIMQLSGMLLSFMTMMGVPLILGIGIDDGVHVMHRWLNEGKGRIFTVFSSTGKAILLTSLTTMLAFGSMVFSVFPGWAWFGEAMFIGVGACFVTTVIFLSGMLGWFERKT
ncbi:MMPL family transporter [candidate division KSB1 bacterium]|nr:MMPL family transporter [candidate division KSB1 bacterium]